MDRLAQFRWQSLALLTLWAVPIWVSHCSRVYTSLKLFPISVIVLLQFDPPVWGSCGSSAESLLSTWISNVQIFIGASPRSLSSVQGVLSLEHSPSLEPFGLVRSKLDFCSRLCTCRWIVVSIWGAQPPSDIAGRLFSWAISTPSQINYCSINVLFLLQWLAHDTSSHPKHCMGLIDLLTIWITLL